jgi:hypothetical protein
MPVQRCRITLAYRWLVNSGERALEISDDATWLLSGESTLFQTRRPGLANH